jgi:abortive infection bacteriophage resistance protein
MKYPKTPLTNQEHIKLLRDRNLLILSEERAIKYLNNIGYFRLTGYMFHLQTKDGNHNFKEEVVFDDIINLYKFDKKLRAILIDYLERIEVAVKAKLTNKYSLKNDFFWYTKKELFADNEIYYSINA